jgi:probable rRNA maturation factor
MSPPAARIEPKRKSRPIAWQIEEPKWRTASLPVLRRAARAALSQTERRGNLTVLLTTDARLRALNEKFRGKPKATNVLSFPSATPEAGYLGDIALAFGVAERESALAKKSLTDHAAHLVAHGVLHLLGYDHETAREARIMESLEVAILKRLGIDDPYVAVLAAE